MNRTVRTIIVAVVAMTVGAIAATPAAAFKIINYQWLTCPAGTATTGLVTGSSTYTHEVEGNNYYLHFVTLYGTLTPCRRIPNDATVYAIGAYGSSDAYGGAYTYINPGFPTPTFDDGSPIDVYPDIQAVCLITNETTRLACVSVVWVDAGYSMVPVIEGPLAVDSPRVAMPAITKMSAVVGGPVTPTCFKCP
ncbi:hypothetical protein [Catellatospora vulcania]|uniref:hypothetical protein n=1 Tax=Catellatospora vulcania TaxID=1460450 RepID=UPI0012D4B6D7|nr:hypothetical protein [Catellatospora vulcania]